MLKIKNKWGKQAQKVVAKDNERVGYMDMWANNETMASITQLHKYILNDGHADWNKI